MKKTQHLIGLLLALFFYCNNANSTNYYVNATTGDNAFNGKSVSQAFRTISTAADLTNPGDTVFIMNGNYSNFVIDRSGSAGLQIVYTNYPGHSPKLVATSGTYALVYISPGTAYITVNGLEIIGWGVNLSLAADTIPAKAQLNCPVVGSPSLVQNPLPKYNGGGITAASGTGVGSHHLVITNNIVHDCTKEGIGFGKCDYVTVEGNTVYNNSWYTIYGTSGITFNRFFNYDNNTTTYRNIVRNNICYNNRMYVPYRNDCKITDGNGIILDIPQDDYNGRSLVANNICFNNGGSGIHTFKMNNTDIFNNVSYLNSASPEINSANIYALQADNVRIMNNIIVARPGKRMNAVNSSTNLIYDYNIFYGGSTYELVGAHSYIQDPKFVNPSTNPAVANFRLQAGSIGVNAGNNSNTTATDYSGNPRPFAGTVDIGAYESTYTGTYNSCVGSSSSSSSLVISNGNGNGLGEGSAGYLYGFVDSRPGVSNQKSRKAFIYPTALLTTIPANTIIKSLKFRRAIQTSTSNTTPSTSVVPPNSGLRVYLRNESADNLGASAFDWNSILPEATNPATLVYGGEANNVIGNSGGWKELVLQTPFTYTGNNLGVYVEYFQSGSITDALDINWIYDNSGPQPLYNTTNYPNQNYGFRSTAASGNTAISNSLGLNNLRRPVITIDYCTTTLPVNLLSFKAINKNNQVLLNWATGTEINNAGFEVQRSVDGIAFETIDFINSKSLSGNSLINNYYTYIDPKSVNGIRFYRLQQKDKDGKTTYSAIATINNSSNQLNTVSVYPNPVGNKLNALLNIVGTTQSASITIQDITGKGLIKFSKQLALGQSNMDIDVSKLASSTYILVIQLSSGERLTQKFIKK